MPLAPAVEPRPDFVRGPQHPRAGPSNLSLPLATLLPRVIAREMVEARLRLLSVSAHLRVNCGGGGGQDSGRAPRSLQTVAGCWKSTCPAGPGPETGPLVVPLLSAPIRGLGAPAGRVTRRGAGPTWDPPHHGGAWTGLPGGDKLASLPPEPSLAAFILEGFVYGQVYGTGADLEKGFSLQKSNFQRTGAEVAGCKRRPRSQAARGCPCPGLRGSSECHSRTLTRGTPSIPGGVSLPLKKGSLLKPERPQNQDPEKGALGTLDHRTPAPLLTARPW